MDEKKKLNSFVFLIKVIMYPVAFIVIFIYEIIIWLFFKLDQAWSALIEIFGKLFHTLLKVFKWALKPVYRLGLWMYNKAILPVMRFINTVSMFLFKGLIKFLHALFDMLFKVYKALSRFFEPVFRLVRKIFSKLAMFFQYIYRILYAILSRVKKGLRTIGKFFLLVYHGTLSLLKFIFEPLIRVVHKVLQMLERVLRILFYPFTQFTKYLNRLVLRPIFTVGKKVINHITDFLTKLVDDMKQLVKRWHMCSKKSSHGFFIC